MQPKFISNLLLQNLSLSKFRQFFKPDLLKSLLLLEITCMKVKLHYHFQMLYVMIFCVHLYPYFIILDSSYIHFQLIKSEGMGQAPKLHMIYTILINSSIFFFFICQCTIMSYLDSGNWTNKNICEITSEKSFDGVSPPVMQDCQVLLVA